jgi:hypothetical protein
MRLCKSYCRHGGRCIIWDEPHTTHDSGACTWTDAEALTKEQADAVLAGKPGGQEYLDILDPMADMMEAVIDAGEED